MGYIWVHSYFNLGYKSNHTPDFIVHYYANCKIKVLYSNIRLLFSLILRIVFPSYVKILLKSILSCMGIFFCFLLSSPIPTNLILGNCYARLLMWCYFLRDRNPKRILVELNKGGLLILCCLTESSFRAFIGDLSLCIRNNETDVSEKFAWPNPLKRNPKSHKWRPGVRGWNIHSFFPWWQWIDHAEEVQKALQNSKIKSRKIKSHIKEKVYGNIQIFQRMYQWKKNPLLLEVKFFGYHDCKELYIVYNVQQKVRLIATLKKKLWLATWSAAHLCRSVMRFKETECSEAAALKKWNIELNVWIWNAILHCRLRSVICIWLLTYWYHNLITIIWILPIVIRQQLWDK